MKDERTFSDGLCQLLLCNIEVIDIGGVVLAVVEGHDLMTDDRLQGIVVVGQVGEGMLQPG